ncbi:MAG: ComEC/Rec2 family competence protein, partial [Victivallaceae bacterium]|nr:ComEC/Rec2 family competence protein [Victivallaceae bacterium]
MPLIGCQNSNAINIVFILWLLISVIILINVYKNLFSEKIFCMFIIFGCVITGYIITLQPIKKYKLPDTCNAHVSGIVEQPVEWQKSCYNFNNKQQYYTVFKLKIYKAETNNICITHINELVRCTIISSTPLNIQRGDLIDVSGVLKKFRHASNPGQFDTASYFAKKDIAYRFTARKGMIKWRNPPYMSAFLKLRRSLDKARKQLANKITGVPGYETEANVLSKMLLGTRGLLPEELTELLQRTNTFHIIAISGLHIGIVCGIWWCVMWLIGVPWKYRGAALLPVLWLYAIMVGLRASVVRASFMFTALAVAPLINRPHRAVQALLTAGLLYLLLWPREVTSFGTQLTFLSVVALLSMASLFALFFDRFAWVRGPAVYDLEHIHRRYFHNILHYFLQIVCATVAIWLITWPVILTRSNLVTPLSWLANLCVVPALGVVLTLGFTSLVLSFVWPFIAELITYANLIFLHFLIKIIEYIAKIPVAYFSTRSLTVMEILCYYYALLITLL